MLQEISNFTDEQNKIVGLVRRYVGKSHQAFYKKLLIECEKRELWVFEFARPDWPNPFQIPLFYDELKRALATETLSEEIKRKIDGELGNPKR